MMNQPDIAMRELPFGLTLISRFKTVIVVCLSATMLSACFGNRVVNPVDDSAEYRTAKSLPPLKRPSGQAAPAPTVASSPVVDEQTTVAPEATVAEQTETAAAPSISNIQSNIVVENDVARLVIESKFDSAWAYLTDKLAASEVTVFTRNKSAERIAIGCAEIGTVVLNGPKRSSRWAIFNRKKAQISEYCSLELAERRGRTVVNILDRSGRIANAEYGQPILERILQP